MSPHMALKLSHGTRPTSNLLITLTGKSKLPSSKLCSLAPKLLEPNVPFCIVLSKVGRSGSINKTFYLSSRRERLERNESLPAPSKEDILMKSVFTQLIDMSQQEIKQIHKDNSQKQLVLRSKDKEQKTILGSCIDDKAGEDYLNDAVLKGEILVKLSKIPVGKNVGPGGYRNESKEIGRNSSYNIKTVEDFKRIRRKNSTSTGSNSVIMTKPIYSTDRVRTIDLSDYKTPVNGKPRRNFSKRVSQSMGHEWQRESEKSVSTAAANTPWSSLKTGKKKYPAHLTKAATSAGKKQEKRMNVLERVTKLAQGLQAKKCARNCRVPNCTIFNLQTVTIPPFEKITRNNTLPSQ